jgi:Glycosyltransferase family 9 (heptosyltransferase)
MNSIYVAPISFGLGDLVVSLPAIQALIAQRSDGCPQTWLVARSAGQAALAERIDGLTGSVDEGSFDPARSDSRFIDLRDHPLQRDYWWGSPEFDRVFGALSINEILARICNDFGIKADFSRPAPLRAHRRSALRDTVLLVTETDGPTKRWPDERWAALADAVRDAGSDVRLVTRAAASTVMPDAGIERIVAPTPGDAIDLVSSCRAVVGVDTGLTHIAVQQNTPTVTICRDRPVFFRPWPHSRVVTGQRCDDACVSIERDYAHHARVSLRGFEWQARTCPVGGPCMASITTPQVVAALGELW